MAYVAYHRHDSRSNIILADSVVTDLDYVNRLKELGQDIMSCCNHGAAYNWKETQMIAAENKLRFRYVVEPYFVLDRFDRTDRTNAHLILAAKTAKGIGDLNELTSEAYISGFYHRPRIDMDLLLRLSPEDIFVTTACVGGIWKYGNEKAEELVKTFKQHFGKSFMLEVQYHNTESQRELNRFILSLYRKHNIPLIMGTDSHYIYPEQGALRELRLEANGIRYDDEDGWYMDFPDEETCVQRFKEQGVLSPSQIKEAIQNTLVFETFEDVKLDKSKKLPNAYPELTEKEREQLYVKMVMEGYNRYYPNVTPEQKEADMKELQYEMDTITQTQTADYFLSLYKIVQRGLEKGGVLTETGRGSAVSYATNRMLGLTSVNRLRIPVTLYPDRFISKDRLESGQLPDEDLNVSNLECFQDGGKEILGEWGCVPMVAYGKLGLLSAWKMYARAEKISFEQSNAVSDMLKRYEMALKYAKDEDEDEDEELDEDEEPEERVKLSDFVKEEYLEMVEASRIYQGIVNSISPHPCAHLLLDRDIRREIGVIRLKKAKSKKSTSKKQEGEEESEYIYAAMVDGSTADKCGYVKADFLRVDVVKLNNEIFKQAGVPQPNADEIIELTKNDPATWSMYEKGFTVGLNQVEREKTTSRVMRFRPKNIVELSAFVAAIRPSFQSMLDTFLSRNRFAFGIPALDKLLQTPEIKSSFLVYQEQIFTVLMKAGISAPDAYTVIKAISKKKKEVIHSFQQQFLDGFVPYIMEDGKTSKEAAKKAAEETWKIIEDSASYSFNASHAYCVAVDSLYSAYAKAHYPYEFYVSALKVYGAKQNKKKLSRVKNEARQAFGIKIVPPKFGEDSRSFFMNKSEGTISDALTSAKFISRPAAETLYQLGQTREYKYFVDLLIDLVSHGTADKRQQEILIKMGYFRNFGSEGKLLAVFEEFHSGKSRYDKKHSDKTKEKRIPLLRQIEEEISGKEMTFAEKLKFETEYLGSPMSLFPDQRGMYTVLAVDEKYSPKIDLYNVTSGTTGRMKVRKDRYGECPLEEGDTIKIEDWVRKDAYSYIDGKAKKNGEKELWILEYEKVS